CRRCSDAAVIIGVAALETRSHKMPTMFNARDADNYERLMGRWSRRLAPLFIEHAGIAPGEEVLEVGCGTGSLTFALAAAAPLGGLTAVRQNRRQHQPPGALARMWAEAGFTDVDQRSLMIRMDFT